MALWGGLPEGAAGGNTLCPTGRQTPAQPVHILRSSQLGKPVAPHDKWYPDRKERGWRSGQRRLEKANAAL